MKAHRAIVRNKEGDLLKEIRFFVGLPKTLFNLGDSKWHGPEPGGSLEVERMFLYPMADLNFVASYSTDKKSALGNPMTLAKLDLPYDNFIEYDKLGYKAWALQVGSRFIPLEETGGII